MKGSSMKLKAVAFSIFLFVCITSAFFLFKSSSSKKDEILKKIIEICSKTKGRNQSLYKINGYPYKHEDKSLAFGWTTYPYENNMRCTGIKFILEWAFPHKDIKVLDIGTDTGYISHCLADNGLIVHGVDSNSDISDCISEATYEGTKNVTEVRQSCIDAYREAYSGKEIEQIELANLVKEYSDIKNVTFESNFVDLNYIKSLKVNQYDAALILSVLHWVNLELGLEKTRVFLDELLKKVPIVIIEATEKREVPDDGSKTSESIKALPEKTEDFFEGLPNLSHFELVPKSYMNLSRPVYILFSKPLSSEINGE